MKFSVHLYREVCFEVREVDAICMEEAIAKSLARAVIGRAVVHDCDGVFMGAIVEIPADEQHAKESRRFVLDSLGGIKVVPFDARKS